jgi:hypothetical protein
MIGIGLFAIAAALAAARAASYTTQQTHTQHQYIVQ